jgi:hypothetical protein
MYCPVDGDEFVEGVVRCPEHDVDLVEEPPELDDEEVRDFVDYFSEAKSLRTARRVLVVAAIVYAIAGVLTSVLYGLANIQGGDSFDLVNIVSSAQMAGRVVALAALGVMTGTLLLRAYTWLRNGDRRVVNGEPSPADGLTRLLLALLVVFTILWALSGIATAGNDADSQTGMVTFGGQEEEPSKTYVNLTAIHFAAYNGAVACLVLMAGRLIVQWHRRLGTNMEDVDLVDEALGSSG